jgi:DnaJ-domain-containing protein 1
MNEGSEGIAHWLERKRRTEGAWAAAICVVALGCGVGAFLLTSALIYAVVRIISFRYLHRNLLSASLALGLTSWSYIRIMARGPISLYLDPTGLWIFEELYSAGPRLLLEGLRQARHCTRLGELDVTACAEILTYLARKNSAVSADELLAHCAQVSWARLKEQMSWLDGVLVLGADGSRVTLMEPFRLWLRSMLPPDQPKARQREPARPRPEPTPDAVPVNEPERLSAYEILGLSRSASLAEIKTAYRKRIRTCHPDLFPSGDEQARALAERWTKALNAAYATLNPRPRTARAQATRKQ